MEEKTMEITKLKVELNAQNHLKQTRIKTFENFRELQAKLEYDDLIRDFQQQCNIVDEKYVDYQVEQEAKDEQEHNARVYENSMQANLDSINFDNLQTLEEEFP